MDHPFPTHGISLDTRCAELSWQAISGQRALPLILDKIRLACNLLYFLMMVREMNFIINKNRIIG
ncbi:MAG: hypothetical protein A3J80_04655 [Desulfobacula sp. RIFOXYB2_FULL_45_6]|nr:MAG: hypothetical protein A3J80_04655 [Desulfobacula sp. RIFOXYB2_FULL_45_6]